MKPSKRISPSLLPAHAKYGPSSMDRIMACPGSVALSEKAPPQDTSVYAEEGTQAHELGEQILCGRTVHLADYPDDMVEAVKQYVAFVDSLLDVDGDSEYYVEERLVYNEDLFGTADAIVVQTLPDKTRHLHVVDYKHGAGVPVGVVENKQLMTYAGLALLTHFKSSHFDSVTLHIVQPRAADGKTKSWRTDVPTISAHMEAVFQAIDIAETQPFLKSGPHCRWCRAKITCPELAAAAGELVAVQPDDNHLTPEHLGELLELAGAVEERIKALRKYAEDRLKAGAPVPGWKLVAKRATASWKNEDAAASFLLGLVTSDKAFKTSLVSPAQARKLVAKDMLPELNNHVESVSSGLTMVPESDKRESAITAGAMQRMADQMAALNLKH